MRRPCARRSPTPCRAASWPSSRTSRSTTPRTKDAIALLSALELDGKVLIVLAESQAETELSFRNLGNVRIDFTANLGTYDLIAADRVLFTMSALDRLTGETSEASAPASASRTPKAAAVPAEPATDEDEPDEDDASGDAEPGDEEGSA